MPKGTRWCTGSTSTCQSPFFLALGAVAIVSLQYLVTGCAGFIANTVARLLLDQGHFVVGIDNFSDAYDPRLKHWRLDQLRGRERFSFVEADVTQPEQLRPLFSGPRRFDAVLNLAARAGVRPSVTNPVVYYQTNTLGTLHLLEFCRNAGVKKFVLASTSSVYGACAAPFTEDVGGLRPVSPYAASKLAAESLAYTYHYLHGIDVSVLRYFTVYGPAGRPDMSVFRFIRWMATGQPLTVYGDGEQLRDFTYVDDIARGTVAALRPLGFEIVNLGSDRPFPLRELIAEIAAELGCSPILERRPAHPADVPVTWAHIERARRLLGWEPQVEFKQGIRNCVAWYRANTELANGLDLGE